MPYTKTTWTDNTTPLSASNMNNLETQYSEATQSLPKDIFLAFVLSGLSATKDSTNASQLDLAAGTAFVEQADGTLRRRDLTAQSFNTATASSTYYLDLNPDGTLSWGTAHSTESGYLSICSVATDSTGNISTVTDTRSLTVEFLHGATALDGSKLVNMPNASTTVAGVLQARTNSTNGAPIALTTLDSFLSATGLPGASAASRYAGATTSGAPTTGTFAVGDYVIDQTGTIWICTAAGTPGTWAQLPKLGAANTWSVAQTFNAGITGSGNTGSLTAGTGITTAANTFTTVQAATGWKATGLTGSTAASRYVGATAAGAPTSGTFAVGDFVIDQTGSVWVCTAAGSPGTWGKVGATSANGTWTPASGTFNVPSGTVINVATIPNGCTKYQLYTTAGSNANMFTMGITRGGASAWVGNSSAYYPSDGYTTALSGTLTGYSSFGQSYLYDGSHYVLGYFQINGNTLQFVTSSAASASSGAATTITWAVE